MENPLLKAAGIKTQPAAKPVAKPKVPPAPTPAQKQKALNQQVKNPPKTIQLGPGLAIPDIQPIPDKMTAYDLKAFGAATGGNKPFHVSEQDWMRRTAYRQSLAGKQAQPQKPQPNPIVDTFNYNQGLVDKSNAETQRVLQTQQDWSNLSQTQRKIATTQPITGQEGFTMKSGDRASLERSMAEFDQEVFGGLTYGTKPEGVPEELWMRRTAYRQRLADKFGWGAEVRNEQVAKYNRDGLVNGQPSLEQRMEAVKGTFDEVPQWQKALMHTTPLTSLAANKGSFESMVSRVLGEQGLGLADKNNAELYLRSFNQFSPISGSGVSSAYSMLTKDPRAINEMNGYEQVALTGADIAAQIVGAGLTGGASSPGMLKNIGNIATRFLAMDLPGYTQAVLDAGSVEGALKMYGDMIRKGLDPKSGANPAERMNAIAMATAIVLGASGKLAGKFAGKGANPTPDLPTKPLAPPIFDPAYPPANFKGNPPTKFPPITSGRPPVKVSGDTAPPVVNPKPTTLDPVADAYSKWQGMDGEEVPSPKPKAARKPKAEPSPEKAGVSSLGQAETSKPVAAKVYHGTGAAFDQYDPATRGSNTGSPSATKATFYTDNGEAASAYANMAAEKLNATVRDKEIADWESKYGDTIERLYKEGRAQEAMELEQARPKSTASPGWLSDSARMRGANVRIENVSLENPLVLDYKGKLGRDIAFSDAIEQAKNAGHDGVIFKNVYDDPIGKKPINVIAKLDSTPNAPTPKIAGQAEAVPPPTPKPTGNPSRGTGRAAGAKVADQPAPEPVKAEVGGKEAWEMTREEIEGVAGYRLVENAGDTLARRRGGVTELTPRFFELEPEDRKWLLIHELGHDMIKPGEGLDRWKDVIEPFRINKDTTRYSTASRYENPFGLRTEPEEMLADGYRSLFDERSYNPDGTLRHVYKPGSPKDILRKEIAKQALSEGKPVPASVLADYPDLAPKPAPKQPDLKPKQAEGVPPIKPPATKPVAQKPGKPADIQKPRQADVKQVADAIGLDLTKERKTVPEIAKSVEDGGYVQSAASSAQKALEGKSLNTEEQVGLAMGLNNIKGQIKGLDAALRKAKNEGNESRALEIIKERDDLVSTHKTMLEGLYKARSESGRSLGAGKFFELADYAVKEDVISLAEAKLKGAVPEAKREQFEGFSERYAAMERELKDAQETIKSARAIEAEYEKKLADAAIKRPPRTSRTQGRIPVDVAKQALKELGAFEPVVGAVPVFSPKQSKAFSTLAKWAIGEVKAGGEVTTDAVVAKMRELVEKNNVGHVLFDEDYYRAIRQALLGDKSGTYSGLLDAADTWLDQRANQFADTVNADKQAAKQTAAELKAEKAALDAADKEFMLARREQIKQALRDKDAELAKKLREETAADREKVRQAKAREREEAKVQGDWDAAFKDAAKKEEAEARVARRNDIKDAMDATPRNRNAEKMAQGLIKGGSKDFGAIVKAIGKKYGLTDLEAASSARRAVYNLEGGLQRRFGRDVNDMSLDIRQKQAELRALKDEIDYNIEKLSPQSLPASLRVVVRANAFTNVVNRGLDIFYNGLRFTGETAAKPINSLLETAWMWALPAHARRTTPRLQFMGTARRAIKAAPAIAQGMWADTRRNWKMGDTALLEKQGFPKVGLNTKNETLNKTVNMFARLPGYTDIPARRSWYEISLLELVDNEVDYMAKQNGWTAAQKMQHRRTLLDNANGELEPMRLAAANAADEMVFANNTKFDQLITKGEKALSSIIGETGKDWAMLGTDILVTPYLRIFAKITGYGTDYLYGSLKAAGAAIGSKSKTGGVPPHVRKRIIELSTRQMFGLAIGYAATEWYKEANKSSNGKEALDKIIRLNPSGYVEIPEVVNAGGVMTPFILLIGLKRIEDSTASPSQKDAWRKDLFATLTIETPALSGASDLARAISLKDDPVKFGARKIANAVIPGAVRQAAKMMDTEPGSSLWEMRERRINTKPDTSKSTKIGKNGPYTSEKTWAEQDKLKTILNEFRSRIPVERNKFPSKK